MLIDTTDNSITVLDTKWFITRDKTSRHLIAVCTPHGLVAEGISMQELLSTIHEIVTDYKNATQDIRL